MPEAERIGITLALEPVHYHTLNTPELTRELLCDMGSSQLKVIFDPINLLHPDDIMAQDSLWGRCIDCFGSNIVAVHMKGAAYTAGESILRDVPFDESIVDYDVLFTHIRQLNVPLLCEGTTPVRAAADAAFLSSLL